MLSCQRLVWSQPSCLKPVFSSFPGEAIRPAAPSAAGAGAACSSCGRLEELGRLPSGPALGLAVVKAHTYTSFPGSRQVARSSVSWRRKEKRRVSLEGARALHTQRSSEAPVKLQHFCCSNAAFTALFQCFPFVRIKIKQPSWL